MKAFFYRLLRYERLQLLFLVIPFVVAAIAMPYASDRVPMQWGIHGKVSWYAPKMWGLLSIPMLLLAVLSFMMLLEGFDKNRRREPDGDLTSHGKAVRNIRLAVSAILVGVYLLQVSASIGWQPDIMRLVPAGVALLCAFMGNFFGKLKPNRYVGIRVPWTLNSESVWRRTHRVAGYVWTVGGMVLAIFALLAPIRIVVPVWIGGFVALCAIPLVVSWQATREERRLLSGDKG